MNVMKSSSAGFCSDDENVSESSSSFFLIIEMKQKQMNCVKQRNKHFFLCLFVSRTSSTSVPTTTSRTSSTSAITATRSTLRFATWSSHRPSRTSPDACLRRSSGWLTDPACTTESTRRTAARRWVHRGAFRPSLAPSSLGPFQPLCMSAQIHTVISAMMLSSHAAKNIQQRQSSFHLLTGDEVSQENWSQQQTRTKCLTRYLTFLLFMMREQFNQLNSETC